MTGPRVHGLAGSPSKRKKPNPKSKAGAKKKEKAKAKACVKLGRAVKKEPVAAAEPVFALTRESMTGPGSAASHAASETTLGPSASVAKARLWGPARSGSAISPTKCSEKLEVGSIMEGAKLGKELNNARRSLEALEKRALMEDAAQIVILKD